MDHIFDTNFYSDRDPSQNMTQMNSLLMNLISTSSICDCQSQPLTQYYNDFYTKVRFSIENTFDKLLSNAPAELRPSKVFESWIGDNYYTDTTQYRAEIPEGLVVPYLSYLEVLIPAQERANQIVDRIINPFSKFLGKLISDEIFRNQVSHQIKEFRNLEPEYVKTIKDMGKCFGKNNYSASAAFGEVVKRNGDWRHVFSQTKLLRELYQAFPNKELTTKLNAMYEMIDALIDQIKVDGYKSVEKEVTQILSSGLYHVAREVELAALTTFRSKVFIESINTTIKNIEEVVQKTKN